MACSGASLVSSDIPPSEYLIGQAVRNLLFKNRLRLENIKFFEHIRLSLIGLCQKTAWSCQLSVIRRTISYRYW
jgi:hypothetical protein